MYLILMIAVLQPCYSIGSQENDSIPIDVIDTWEIEYASDIQGISFVDFPFALAIRSNGNRRIYLADEQCGYMDQIVLPENIEGSGLAYNCSNMNFYINTSSGEIIFSDDSGTWNSLLQTEPGTGMLFPDWHDPSDLFEIIPFSPHRLCITDLQSHDQEYFDLPGTNPDDELTALIAGTTSVSSEGIPHYALIATTRYSSKFLFYIWDNLDGYIIYAVEESPITVQESYGLTYTYKCDEIYWSYKGADDKYYISLLGIDFFYFADR